MLEAVEREKKENVIRGRYYSDGKVKESESLILETNKKESKTDYAKRLNDGTMVTVVCITYKHEEFIAQALDSFLMQKTNFKFKIFVGEDYGPDGTANIVREYAERYPEIIVPFIRKENMGAQRNLIDLCQRATSPYIAFCEGDDYWVDEYKLQKQFDYMEANPDIRVCCTQTEIIAPSDWHLRSWYKTLSEGKIVLPDSTPGYRRFKTFTPENILDINVAHTSTHFYRWNYDLEIPDWYYQGIIGDTPLLLMQMGTTRLGHIPEITSAYRINDGSIFFNKDKEAHFLNTRRDMVRYLTGLREYALDHFENYPITAIENRIKLETANYLEILVRKGDSKAITEFSESYPEAMRISLNAYLSFYKDQRTITGKYTWEGYQMIARNRYFRQIMYPFVKMALLCKHLGRNICSLKNVFRRKVISLVSFVLYWKNTLVKKDNSIWVFSGFNKTNYMDNSKYLYEYVLEHHPEINAVWITKSRDVYQMLKEQGMPVVMMHTQKCRKLVSHAAIAVTDHFRMSDYDALSGLNDTTKIVQLWHGVGLKKIGDLKNTNVPGVKFSDDILPIAGESRLQRIKKCLKYFRYAYHRELFEKYFMLVCPGNERIEQIAKPWSIPNESCFLSGHPRNIHLHQAKRSDEFLRVLYAPTYRWKVPEECFLVNQIIENAKIIQETMERHNGEFMIRLHPHTWRNYNMELDRVSEQYDRIRIDHDKDVYASLHNYDVLISDYSSIAYDFILLDRPVVFFNYDFEKFVKSECKLNYDYNLYSPGIKTSSWEETLLAIEQYIENPEKDGEWRRKIRDEFYEMSVNDENNSERIVQEIKRRLEKSGKDKK